METIINDFNERVEEVNKYFKILEILNNENITIFRKTQKRKFIVRLDSDALKIMKSTCFLLLYNLVESSIRGAFSELYKQINLNLSEFINFQKEFRDLWIDQHLKNIDISSNKGTYKRIVEDIINKLIIDKNFELDPKLLPISGNIDAKKVRELCESHTIPHKAHYRALNGAELKTIKDKRNDLAHGIVSFGECGQEYTVSVLHDIKQQAIVYLRSSLRNMKKFIDNKEYLIANA